MATKKQGLRSLRDLTQHLTTRADDSHAPPVFTFPKALSPFREIRDMSNPGKVLRVGRIKPHTPPLVRAPVNSFEFHSCERTSQAGYLTP